MSRHETYLWAALIGGLFMVMVWIGTAPDSDAARGWSVCPSEDSGSHCVWDSKHQGNGQGKSFLRYSPDEPVMFITHRRAHRLSHA